MVVRGPPLYEAFFRGKYNFLSKWIINYMWCDFVNLTVPPKFALWTGNPTPCLCSTTHMSSLQVIEFSKTMRFIIETLQSLAFWICLVKCGLRTRKGEMGGNGGNHHEKLGHKKISCGSQFTIPDTAGTSHDPAHNITDMRSSKPNQANQNSDFSYPFISSISFSSSSPISLFLVHNSTIIEEHKVNSFLCISPFHYHEFTPSCSIRRVQHTLRTVYTIETLSALHSDNYELTPECRSNFWHASLHRWTATRQFSIRPAKVKSPRHIPMDLS